MPKTKDIEIKKARGRVINEEEEKEIDPEIIVGEEEDDEISEEESALLDVDEIDPFGDKWEQ